MRLPLFTDGIMDIDYFTGVYNMQNAMVRGGWLLGEKYKGTWGKKWKIELKNGLSHLFCLYILKNFPSAACRYAREKWNEKDGRGGFLISYRKRISAMLPLTRIFI